MAGSALLEPVGENIWLAEGGIVSFYGAPYPTRSVIVRLPSGDLWIWSPIELTAELRQAVEGLGRPAHLVSPNKIHHLFLAEWKKAWPGAKLWGPASTVHPRAPQQEDFQHQQRSHPERTPTRQTPTRHDAESGAAAARNRPGANHHSSGTRPPGRSGAAERVQ